MQNNTKPTKARRTHNKHTKKIITKRLQNSKEKTQWKQHSMAAGCGELDRESRAQSGESGSRFERWGLLWEPWPLCLDLPVFFFCFLGSFLGYQLVITRKLTVFLVIFLFLTLPKVPFRDYFLFFLGFWKANPSLWHASAKATRKSRENAPRRDPWEQLYIGKS